VSAGLLSIAVFALGCRELPKRPVEPLSRVVLDILFDPTSGADWSEERFEKAVQDPLRELVQHGLPERSKVELFVVGDQTNRPRRAWTFRYSEGTRWQEDEIHDRKEIAGQLDAELEAVWTADKRAGSGLRSCILSAVYFLRKFAQSEESQTRTLIIVSDMLEACSSKLSLDEQVVNMEADLSSLDRVDLSILSGGLEIYDDVQILYVPGVGFESPSRRSQLEQAWQPVFETLGVKGRDVAFGRTVGWRAGVAERSGTSHTDEPK